MEDFLNQYNFDFAIEITGFTTAWYESTKKLFKQTKSDVDDYDLFEMKNLKFLERYFEKVNPIGGAISKRGASGRLVHQFFIKLKTVTQLILL